MSNRVCVLAVALALSLGCGKEKSVDETRKEPVAAVSAPALVLDHVTLLHTESVIESRVSDQDKLASALKEVVTIINAYDAAHAGALPAAFDVVLVARPTATRAWFVGEQGDVPVPELEATIAKLPPFGVTEGNVGLVMTIVRTGTKAVERGPHLPAAWKAATSSGGEQVDQVIDKAWPR